MGYTNPQSECELSLFSDQTCSIEKIQNWIQYVIAALNVSPCYITHVQDYLV